MTIAIAAVFPWGRVQSIMLRRPGLSAEQGIVFATDSRFSWSTSPKHDDLGRKVYPIARNAALVFSSGDVVGAKMIADALGAYAREARPDRGDSLLSDLPTVASQAWKQGPNPGERVHLLIGIYVPDGGPVVIRLASDSGFSPIFVPGVQVVGSKEAEAAFRSHLNAIDDEEASRGNYVLKPVGWNIRIVAALNSTLRQPGITRVIGGRIQTVLLTKDGLTENELSHVSVDDDPFDSRAWEKATLPLAKTHGYVQRVRSEE